MCILATHVDQVFPLYTLAVRALNLHRLYILVLGVKSLPLVVSCFSTNNIARGMVRGSQVRFQFT
jgi:hypothetical protein